jgi:uncharacterized RDD family membrane protein YckC
MQCSNHPTITDGIGRCIRCGRPFCESCLVQIRGGAYCADCKGEQVRDIQSGTVQGELELATVGRRFAALWLDSFIFGMIGAFVAVLLVMATADVTSDESPDALFFLIMIGAVAVWIVYEGLLLQYRGQTLGKMALGIKVVTPDGNDIGVGQAWGRAVLRQVFFSYFSLINYLPAVFTKQRTCIHDLIVKTRVARVRR